MKTMARIVLYLMILCFCGCSSKKDEVIIAVNTGNRVGYFTDSKGNIIIDKQFDGVSSFSNGLAKVKQNGKWGFVNTKRLHRIPASSRSILKACSSRWLMTPIRVLSC